MQATTLALAVMLALAVTALPAFVPEAEEVSFAGSAVAGPPCVIGSDGRCIIQIVCVREPCP